MWNDQTGGTNRFLMRRALARQKPPPRASCCQRLSQTYYSGMGPPQTSRLCIERYPQSQRVCAVVVERPDRRYQPIPHL